MPDIWDVDVDSQFPPAPGIKILDEARLRVTLRRLRCTVLIPVAVVLVTAYALFVFCARIGFLHQNVADNLGNCLEVAGPTVGAWACLRVWWQIRKLGSSDRGYQQRAALLFGVAGTAWAAGQAVWATGSLLNLDPELLFPSVGDIGFLVAIPLFAAGVITCLSNGDTAAGRVKEILDGALIAASLLCAAWQTLVGSYSGYFTRSPQDVDIRMAFLYPACDAVLCAIVLAAMTQGRHLADRRYYLVAAATAALTVADVGFAQQVVRGLEVAAAYSDLGWISCFLLLAYAVSFSGLPVRATPDPVTAAGSWSIIPFAIAPLAVLFRLGQSLVTDGLDLFTVLITPTILSVILLRQWFAQREHHELMNLEQSFKHRTADLEAVETFAGLVLLREEFPDALTTQPSDRDREITNSFIAALGRMNAAQRLLERKVWEYTPVKKRKAVAGSRRFRP